ncbi:MAG: electron transfer flavoprotein subunit beta/FixA family protein [Victivallales bacterium]|jgi:electron transfer flavoprotein beta subunit|nr:electron transfer flavoprotein subunit beta/FixA family protein [Victivallales bacterium]
MKIIVCIKQVPGTSEVEIDPKTGVLKRDGVESKMNPYDLYALETALRFKQTHGAEITVVTMGPPQAESVIREAFMMGVDHGIILSDRRFGGSDVLATAYTLSQGIKTSGGADLIICGKQTTDGDTAQVGAELAEFLGIAHVAGVSQIHELSDREIALDLDLPLHIESVKVKLPGLVCVEKGIYEPRLPSFRRKLETAGRDIKVYTLDDMVDTDPNHYGLSGSPTQVKRIFPPESTNTHESWEGSDAELAERLFELLEDRKFLQQLR